MNGLITANYTEQDIVRYKYGTGLAAHGPALKEIKKVLEYDDLEKIVDFLAQAEKRGR